MRIPYPQQQIGTEDNSPSLLVTHESTRSGTDTPSCNAYQAPGALQKESQLIFKDSLLKI